MAATAAAPAAVVKQRLSKDKRDMYYRRAKELGYRSRSAFKLLQIDETFQLLKHVTRAVDLCAAPGGWSQVLNQRLRANASAAAPPALTPTAAPAVTDSKSAPAATAVAAPTASPAAATANAVTSVAGSGGGGSAAWSPVAPLIVAVDLQSMPPIDGVDFLLADITTTQTARDIITRLNGERAQIVVCDAAPDVTGMHDMDQYLQAQLLLCALNISRAVLIGGGSFVAKLFRGRYVSHVYAALAPYFDSVVIAKPKASRNSSLEAFVVCRGFKFDPAATIDLSQRLTLRAPNATAADVDSPTLCVPAFTLHSTPATASTATAPTPAADQKQPPSAVVSSSTAAAVRGVEFVCCRSTIDCYDSDQSYPLIDPTAAAGAAPYVYRAPVAPPVMTPYQHSVQLKRSGGGAAKQSKKAAVATSTAASDSKS